jgi:4-alpha-glucanotransferase
VSTAAAPRSLVQTSYVDTDGVRHGASPDTVRTLTELLAVDDAPHAVPPTIVAWDGLGTIPLRVEGVRSDEARVHLVLEDGAPVEHHAPIDADGSVLLPPLPFGAHRAEVRIGGVTETTTVLAAPRTLGGSPVRRARRFGVFAPTYALRRADGDRGMGDLRDLRTLGEWAADRRAGLLATLPLLPTFLGAGQEPFDPSPYSPVSRLMWNEAYLDLDALPGGPSAPRPSPTADGLVDWRAQGALVRSALDAAVSALGDRGFDEVVAWARSEPHVHAYATFRAATEAGAGAPPDPAVRRRHLLGQWAMEQQLSALAVGLERHGQRLYLDLPIGTHRDGFDTWLHPELFVRDCSVGAPPDDFQPHGQDWGFPPMHPVVSRQDGHAHLRAALAHHLRHAGVLRVDHVMAVHRLWWVPPGASSADGAYVRYPADELYACLTLEATRAGAEVVGEDLGTVPGEVRRSLGRHGLGGMYARQFLPVQDPPLPRRRDLALLGTHDTATFASWWAEQGGGDTLHALDRFQQELGRSAARWVLANLEDQWAETEPQNRPGLGPDAYPSWRRRTARPVDDLGRGPADLIDSLHSSRGGRP